jgi:peptidoglycan/LPS O-acetylase OafA/YrhL
MPMSENLVHAEASPTPAVTSAGPPDTRSHIAALDGLRFIAAACVLVAHGYHYLILLQDNSKISPYNAPILALSTVGMTLFFSLSGFVIHYNYASSVSLPGGVRAFAVARFARLYPLFLLVFSIDTLRLLHHADGKTDLLGPLPLFLTFTDSWWFWAFGDRVADQAYSNASTVMWSLSTEAFFYVIYPVVAPLLRRLTESRLLLTGAAVALVGGVVVTQVISHRAGLVEWAQIYTGNPVAAAQFPAWIFFNSPWIRVFEFLLGAIAAQYVMSGGADSRRMGVACGAALILLVSAYVYTNIYLMPISGGITTCLGFAFAIVITASATSATGPLRMLSSKWMVRGGQASYSLYLLHYWVMHDIGHKLADPQPTAVRAVIFLVLMVVAVAVSQVSYRFFERPATRLTRKLLSPRGA